MTVYSSYFLCSISVSDFYSLPTLIIFVKNELLSLLDNGSGTDQKLFFPEICFLISHCNSYPLIDYVCDKFSQFKPKCKWPGSLFTFLGPLHMNKQPGCLSYWDKFCCLFILAISAQSTRMKFKKQNYPKWLLILDPSLSGCTSNTHMQWNVVWVCSVTNTMFEV